MNNEKRILWQSLAWQGFELLQLNQKESIQAHSILVGKSDMGVPFAIEYTITLTPTWSIKTVVIKSLVDDKIIHLSLKDGNWYNNKNVLQTAFAETSFIDISLSPFTNTLPIKQLSFGNKSQNKIDVLYIDLPNFTIRKVQQVYKKINNTNYRYQDIEVKDFAADITVDDEGLVINYPGLFKRL